MLVICGGDGAGGDKDLEGGWRGWKRQSGDKKKTQQTFTPG